MGPPRKESGPRILRSPVPVEGYQKSGDERRRHLRRGDRQADDEQREQPGTPASCTRNNLNSFL
jgi:hypothetical protein